MNKERPVLNGLIKENMSVIEVFQNQTLRPIIKMQHNLLISSLREYLKIRKIDFSIVSLEKINQKIKIIFLKDNSYKNFITGIIVGHFTKNELDFYHLNSSELKRRILKIIAQRIKDSVGEIIA